jgi:hypothetical protein
VPDPAAASADQWRTRSRCRWAACRARWRACARSPGPPTCPRPPRCSPGARQRPPAPPRSRRCGRGGSLVEARATELHFGCTSMHVGASNWGRWLRRAPVEHLPTKVRVGYQGIIKHSAWGAPWACAVERALTRRGRRGRAARQAWRRRPAFRWMRRRCARSCRPSTSWPLCSRRRADGRRPACPRALAPTEARSHAYTRAFEAVCGALPCTTPGGACACAPWCHRLSPPRPPARAEAARAARRAAWRPARQAGLGRGCGALRGA